MEKAAMPFPVILFKNEIILSFYLIFCFYLSVVTIFSCQSLLCRRHACSENGLANVSFSIVCLSIRPSFGGNPECPVKLLFFHNIPCPIFICRPVWDTYALFPFVSLFIRPLKTLKVKNDFYIFPLGADVAPDNIYSFFLIVYYDSCKYTNKLNKKE